MKILPLLIIALIFALLTSCSAEAPFPEDENVDQVQQALCPTVMDCNSNRPPGTTLSGTDYCGTGPIKCFWQTFMGFTITYIYPPAGCTNCVNNATGVQGACYQTDPPATWTCS